MLGVLAVELVEQPRRARHHLARARVIRVEGAQRVELDPGDDVLGQPRRVVAQVLLQLVAVAQPVQRHPEARDPQPRLHAGGLEDLGEQQDRLRVDRRVVGADRLGADLPELAEAALLRTLATEEAREVPELRRLRQLVHAVLQVGTADRGRALGAQRDALGIRVVERVHLLLHDVGRLADAAGEQLGRLERRRLDPPVAGALEDPARVTLERGARERLIAQHVVRAARCLDPPAHASWARNGFVARSRPIVVLPMWPG